MSSDTIVEAHVPCIFDGCGSSDGFTWYEDHGYCFVCKGRVNHGPNGETSTSSQRHRRKKKAKSPLLEKERVQALQSRGLYLETCAKYDYFLARDDRNNLVQVAPYRDQDGRVSAQKVRGKDKQFRTTGEFRETQLFGQHLWRTGGKRLVITEGEIDALSAYQILGSWPVVSIPNGAQGAVAAIQTNLEFVESYDEVILCFDQDIEGQKAAKAVSEMLTPGKVKIMELSEKDANDMLLENKIAEFTTAFWEARSVEPSGIVDGADLWDEVSTPAVMGATLPWEGLTKMTYGQRSGELWTWTAGSGMGKSEFVAQLAHWNLIEHDETIGYVALEDALRQSAKRFVAKELAIPIHLPGNEVAEEELRAAFLRTTGSGKVFFYDHWGSQESDKILSKIRFLIRGKGCNTIVLDHLSIIVSGLEDNDERKVIDKLMTDLRSLVEETGVKMHLVSHLKRPMKGKGHEEGAKVSLGHLRGSHSIVQLSDMVIGLERNQQAKAASNVTKIRVLKNRYSGNTGLACAVAYDSATGLLTEVPLGDYEDDQDPEQSYGEQLEDY